MKSKVLVQTERLHKVYDSTVAVDDVSFDVYEGEIFGMVGLNGAGKTTTVECVEGLRRPDGGRVRVLGLDPQQDGYALREPIGIQLQEPQLQDRLKVWEALDLFAGFYSPSADWQGLLDQLGLADSATHISPTSPAVRNSACSSRWPWSTTPNSYSWTS